MILASAVCTYPEVAHLMSHLRPHDAAEVAAVGGTVDTLWDSIEKADDVIVIRDDVGRLVAIGGLNAHPQDPQQGFVWLLGTDLLDGHLKELHRRVGPVFAAWHQRYKVLTNYTAKRNVRVLRWLRRIGCTLLGEVPVNGVPFIHFIHEADHV